MKSMLECPVEFNTVNANKIRVIAVFVCLINIAFLFFQHWAIAIFSLIDFADRAFLKGKFSFLGIISNSIIKLGYIKEENADMGAKRFAAKVGFFITLIILVANLIGYTKTSLFFACTIVLFSFLEAAFGFCAGCIMYTLLKKARLIK